MAAAKSLPNESRRTRLIMLRGIQAHVYGNGILGLEIEEEELSQAERDMIRKLFPNVYERVYSLLDHEAVIASLVYDEAIPHAPKHDIINLK